MIIYRPTKIYKFSRSIIQLKKMKKIFIIFTIGILIVSCNKKIDCSKNDVACTEEFATIVIELVDSDGNPYILDSYKTIKKSEQEVIVINDDFSNNKYYPVLNDLHKNKTTFEGEIFIFEGVNNNVVVVSEEFVINADCCHINLVSGNTKIIL